MALTKAKLMELIDNGDIDVGGGGLSPNLLHNWDFRNPVNQRGGTWFSGANVYGLDRWMNPSWGGAYGWDSSGFVVNAGGITQRIERRPGLEGKIATLSWCVSGKIYSTTFTLPSVVGTSATVSSVTMDDSITVVPGVWLSSSYINVEFGITAQSTGWQMVKLELGTVSTLHLDPPVDHAVELAKCQRYFIKYANVDLFGLIGSSTTTGWFSFYLPCAMRVTPTLSVSGAISLWKYNGTAISHLVSSLGSLELKESQITIEFNGSGFTAGVAHASIIDFSLSSDL